MVNNFVFLQLLNGCLSRIAKCVFTNFRLSVELEKFENAGCCGMSKTNHRKKNFMKKILKMTGAVVHTCPAKHLFLKPSPNLLDKSFIHMAKALHLFKFLYLTFANARKIGRPTRLNLF